MLHFAPHGNQTLTGRTIPNQRAGLLRRSPLLIIGAVVLLCAAMVGVGWSVSASNIKSSLVPKLNPKLSAPLLPAGSTITVNGTGDVVNGNDGTCTLREAIIAANSNSASGPAAGECAAGSGTDDIIVFSPAVVSPISLTGGELGITESVTISGPGAGLLTVQRSTAGGTPQFRIFNITQGKTVSISGLTMSNGNAVGDNGGAIFIDRATLTVTNCAFNQNSANAGGAIHSSAIFGNATLTLINSTFSQNSATTGVGQGGAVYIHGENGTATLTVTGSTFSQSAAKEGGGVFTVGLNAGGTSNSTVTNSTFSQNSASASGGGFVNAADDGAVATAIITNTTFSENTAQEGGAIFQVAPNGTADMSVINSTLSQNTGSVDGGGIFNNAFEAGTATLSLTNSTFSENSSGVGGGIFNYTHSTHESGVPQGNAIVHLGNTILKRGGASGANILNDPDGIVTSLGNNLSDDSAGAGGGTGPGGFLNQSGDQRNTDPLLGALANNGGPNQTHLLLPGSPAINAGSNAVAVDQNGSPLTTDERGAGFARIVSSTVDIGAVEVSYAINATSGTPQSTTVNSAFGTQLQATVTEHGNPQGGLTVNFVAPASGASGTFPGSVTSASVATNGSGVSTAPVFTANSTTGSYNVTANTSPALATAATFNLTNNPSGPSPSLSIVQQPTNTTAGQSISPAVTIAILDEFGAPTTSTANVSVSIGTNPNGGTLSGTTTVAAVNGTATFSNLSINKAGTGYTLNANSSGVTPATSSPFNITAAAPNKLIFGQQPSNGQTGQTIAPPVTVLIVDTFGNSTASTANVAIAIGTNPNGGTLSGTVSRAAVSGTATFNDLSINKSGTGYTLSASSSGLTGVISNGFNIAGSPASIVATAGGGQSAPLNTAFGTLLKATVTDSLGDPVGGVSVQFIAPSSGASGTFSGGVTTSTVVTGGDGVATAGVLTANSTAGTYNVTANVSPALATPATFTLTNSSVSCVSNPVVTNNSDSAAGSLRDSINNACAGSTITFGPGVVSPITLTSDTISITKNVTITGPGPSLLTVRRSPAGGTPQFRIFSITQGTTVNISGLTISNGNTVGGDGGAIFLDRATLTVTNCAFSQNSSDLGGAIHSSAVFGTANLTIINSSFSQNAATTGSLGQGGAVYAHGESGTSNLTVLNSTFNQNTALEGGGIFNVGLGASGFANVTVVNSTFTQNSATDDSGGIINDALSSGTASLAVTNSTFSENSSPLGGALFNFTNPSIPGTATLQITNTILKRGAASGQNIVNTGSVTSLGHNLSDDAVNGDNGTAPGGYLNQPGDKRNTDPLLGALANNGGPTLTHVLLPGSPAIDAGDNARVTNPPFIGPPFTDQRGTGFGRIANTTVDIGAVEIKNNQTITFGPLSNKNFGDAPFTVSATASSGLPVSFQIFSGPATISGNTVTITGLGTVTVRATQAGDFNFNAAPPVDQSFTVSKGNQTITVNTHAPSGAPINTGFTVAATSSSGLPVSYSSSGVCTNVGATFTMTNATGTCTVKYDQAGNTNYNPAPQVTESVAAQQTAQTITFGPLSNKTFGDPPFTVSATSTSGLPVSFQIFSGPATISGNTVTITGAGTVTVRATQAGDSNFGPANPVDQPFTVAKSNQTITFGALANKAFSDPDFAVSATASSGLSVSFAASGNCTVTGATVHLTGAGSCTITASQAGNGNVNPATDVPQSFNISKAVAITTVSSSNNPSTLGSLVTFTASVTSPAGTPTGTLQFKDNGVNLGGLGNVDNPVATVGGLSAGTHVITVEYSGDAIFLASTGTLPGGQLVTNQAVVSLSQSTYSVSESDGFRTITINRAGDTTPAVSVDYATSDGTASLLPCSTTNGLASSRCDFTSASGTLKFASGETSKSFVVLINQDSYVEGPETLGVTLFNATGGVILLSDATITIDDDASEPSTNPNDVPSDFVRQQYHDFLNREADASGLAFWTNEIASCGSNAQCIDVKRVNVSAAFFLSIEFQGTGYLVERLYKTAYGDASGTSTVGGAHQLPVPIVRLNEFLHDSQEIGLGVVVGQGNWEQVLENNKQAFTAEFVQRSRFTTALPSTMTPAQFVDTLNANAGNPLSASERNQLVNSLTANALTRAQVLRAVAEDPDLVSAESNRAFVLMQFLGYLRRNPNDPQDIDYSGYDFWLTKLNQFNGNFQNAEMVKAFITSAEYRKRFGSQ